MARKRHTNEDPLELIREIEVHLAAGSDVSEACRKTGISDAMRCNWRRKLGGMGRPRFSEMRALEKENKRLKKIVAELELDKESLDF
ncbi:MAG: transposase [Pseudomonadota bacterium]